MYNYSPIELELRKIKTMPTVVVTGNKPFLVSFLFPVTRRPNGLAPKSIGSQILYFYSPVKYQLCRFKTPGGNQLFWGDFCHPVALSTNQILCLKICPLNFHSDGCTAN